MKIDYHGRWLRLSLNLELFPGRSPDRIRYRPERHAAAVRRRLLRRIQAQWVPPVTSR